MAKATRDPGEHMVYSEKINEVGSRVDGLMEFGRSED